MRAVAICIYDGVGRLLRGSVDTRLRMTAVETWGSMFTITWSIARGNIHVTERSAPWIIWGGEKGKNADARRSI